MPIKVSDRIINREKGTLPSMTTQQLSLLFCCETSCIVKSFVNVGIVAGLVNKVQRFLPSWSSLFGLGYDYQIFSLFSWFSLFPFVESWLGYFCQNPIAYYSQGKRERATKDKNCVRRKLFVSCYCFSRVGLKQGPTLYNRQTNP